MLANLLSITILNCLFPHNILLLAIELEWFVAYWNLGQSVVVIPIHPPPPLGSSIYLVSYKIVVIKANNWYQSNFNIRFTI